MIRRITITLACLAAVGVPAAERFDGYAEYRQPGTVIIDGQKIGATPKTSFRGCASLEAVTLGVGMKVDGNRLPTGAVQAERIECTPWVVSPEEQRMIAGSDEAEQQWVRAGTLTMGDKAVGALLKDGPDVNRVRQMVAKLAPAYLGTGKFRSYVVDTKEWNAMVMPNGAVFVFRGLLNDLDEHEMAIVLGHEIAHFTHHHSVKGARQRKTSRMIGGAIGIAGQVAGGVTQVATSTGSSLATSALSSGYGRDLEDQADRVGLRYAFVGGYDVTRAPGLWQKFLDKYGQESALTNFFFSDHSRASARKKNLQEQIAWNYK
jgi:hypothetical protein